MAKSSAKPRPTDEERRAKLALLTSDVASVNLLDGGTIPSGPSSPPAPTSPEPSTETAPATAGAVDAVKEVAIPAAPFASTSEGDAAAQAATVTAAPAPDEQENNQEQEGEKSQAPAHVEPVAADLAHVEPAPVPAAVAPEPTSAPAVASVAAAPIAAPPVAAVPELPATEVASDDEADAGADGVGEPTTAKPAAAGVFGELDLVALFAPSAEKKSTTLRVTTANQQFFSQLGLVLGNNASAPDIIHNILTMFRTQNEPALKRLIKKALAKEFK